MKTPDAARLTPSWLRRVVPEGFATATLAIQGQSPLLMNSPEADHDSALFRAYTLLGQKKGKTADDEARLRELEWEIRIYLDPEIGPYIPGRSVKALLVESGGKFRKGATLKRSLITTLFRIPLEYDGPRDQGGLWEAGYRYTTMVQNAGFGSGRVLRCRPMFKDWSLNVDLAFDPEEIDADTLGLIVERSQRYGLGDFRASSGGDFGAFSATLSVDRTSRAQRAPLGAKARNGHDEAAHEVARTRLMKPDDLVRA